MDLSACWMSQGWSIPPTSPRSCVLTPGHALEPSAPSAVVCPVSHRGQEIPEDIEGRQTLRTSASRSTQQDHRCALRIGTGRAGMILVLRQRSRTKCELLLLFFLRTRKICGEGRLVGSMMRKAPRGAYSHANPPPAPSRSTGRTGCACRREFLIHERHQNHKFAGVLIELKFALTVLQRGANFDFGN